MIPPAPGDDIPGFRPACRSEAPMTPGEPQLHFDWNRLWSFQYRHKPDLELNDGTL